MATTTQLLNTKNEFLQDYAKLLFKNGFTIITRAEDSNWFLFSRDNKIGNASQGFSRYTGITLGTNHKPNKDYGTGFRYKDDSTQLTVEDAENCLNYKGFKVKKAIKEPLLYSGVADYILNNEWAKYYAIVPELK